MRPLTEGAPEAAELLDDAAFLSARPGWDLVVTTDMVVEGVHFLPSDPPDLVARKLLRVNLSDLAAKAAEPFGYLLAIAWPPAWDETARVRFADGLAEDQPRFGVKLLGGDTVATPGPMTASMTAVGYAPAGRAVRRSGAKVGDGLYVTGTIGDGWLGLQVGRGELEGIDARLRAGLLDRYRLPQPRVEQTPLLRESAHACIDVSDGLVADAGHLGRASGVGVEIWLEALPVSEGAGTWLALQPSASAALIQLATGGDDYELLAAGSDERLGGLTQVGRCVEGAGVLVRHLGAEVEVGRCGWRYG